jgi:hypothetical protein
MRAPTAGKVVAGLLVVGTLATLWAIYQPSLGTPDRVQPPPKPPLLRATHAVVIVDGTRTAPHRRASITCDGTRKHATGFWAREPGHACDALASTRAALLSGPGCLTPRPGRVQLRVSGRLEGRRFDHRAQEGGCPDVRGWLAVNALALPVIAPERQAKDRPKG